MKLRIWLFTLLVLLLTAAMPVRAGAEEAEARDISGECGLDCAVETAGEALLDGDRMSPYSLPEGTGITLTHPEGIGSLYLIFDRDYGEYSVTDNDSGITGVWGTQRFLHDFVDLEGFFSHAPTSVTLTFENGDVWLNELTAFSSGEVPAYVQKWEWPEDERADLILFSAHCDDEQLFFAGMIPYYAGELDYRVQVVYLTDHKNLYSWRVHEGLDGLWNVGLRRYPVFGPFADHYCRSREKAYALYQEDGVTERDLAAFITEQLRRFRPLVVVSHDVNGEYGHGQHMTCADAVIAASEISGSPEIYPESEEKYGTWEVPKVYLHLYELNRIWMDWDRPLARFDGMTAYHVTKDLGFPSHESQVDGFAWYMEQYDTAADIEYYSPCAFGLYRSTVGPDVEKNDFFENLTIYREQDRIAQELADLEAERLAEEKKAREEALRQEQEAQAAARFEEQTQKTAPRILLLAGTVLVLLTGAICAALVIRRKKYRGK